ncbi:MAG: spermidine/putrescine ABC transporter substrate-binding protein [Deltaproteobacteria bacterium]|jgi:spermidine/putrescine transport system substrate-binding protein|nr:spermidine/putrescine ABC transporter substrate-binding protein [Deltaproteobacteria bacterium]
MTGLRTVAFLLAVTLFCGFSPFSASAARPETAQEVVVYNWSEYIPQDVLDDFSKETGIKVVYSTFESNEAMYAKVKLLRGKGYDVVVPSTYFVELLRDEKLIQPLDRTRIKNLENLDPTLLNQAYDPGNAYSVPYMCGILGLSYNSKYIKPGTLKAWKDLLRPEFKGKIILTDDLRDAFGLALLAKGHSVNSVDPAEIRQAADFLGQLKSSVRVFDVTAIKQALISEEVWTGPIWNGDYLVALDENPDLAFIFPEEGGIPWVDSFVITSGAVNVENAYAFISYMLRPDVALRCMEEFKYTSPNLAAVSLLPPEQRQNRIFIPGPEEMKNAEYILSIGKTLEEYEKYWERIKALR